MKIRKTSTDRLLKRLNQIINDNIDSYKKLHIICELRKRMWGKMGGKIR